MYKNIMKISKTIKSRYLTKWAFPREIGTSNEPYGFGYEGEGVFIAEHIDEKTSDFLYSLIDFDKLNRRETNSEVQKDLATIKKMLLSFIKNNPGTENDPGAEDFFLFWDAYAGEEIKRSFGDETFNEFHSYVSIYIDAIKNIEDYIEVDLSPMEDGDPT